MPIIITGAGGTNELLEFDAASSGPNGESPGSPLAVGAGTNYGLLQHSYAAAPLNVLYASSIDTEGEIPVSRRYGNRTITMQLDMVDTGVVLLGTLQEKIAKIQREGGTLKRTLMSGTVVYYDLVAADGWDPNFDVAYYIGGLIQVSFTLQAAPLARGVEVEL